MKQSTKLLSLVLALVMAFSCMSVIANAALPNPHEIDNAIAYDAIDDANLTPEQVANIIMDLLDELIKDGEMKDLDLSILGTVRMDSLDHIVGDFYGLYDSFWWTIGSGLLGDVGKLNLDNLNDTQRANGDLNFLYDVLQLLSVNADILSEVAYGIGDDGLSLGLVGNFISLGDIEDMLADIPKMVIEMVYDMIIPGSYNPATNDDGSLVYPNKSYPSVEDLNGAALPAEVDTLDEILNHAATALLVYPQQYTWEDIIVKDETTGEDVDSGEDRKVWDEDLLIMPTLAAEGYDAVKAKINLTDSSNSVFGLLDKIVPYAIYDLGINALNNNLKKALFEAVEAEVEEIDLGKVPAAVATAFELSATDGEESYVNYIGYDKILKHEGIWYYTTLESTPLYDDKGDVLTDKDGNEQTEKKRFVYQINLAAANEFAEFINWDWNFTAPVPGKNDKTAETLSELNYDAYIEEYKSITESLNHIVYIVYEVGLSDTVKDEFEAMVNPNGWEDGTTSDMFVSNITNVLKYLLAEHADKIFGSTSPYVAWEYSEASAGDRATDETVYVENMTIMELIAHIGPVFFEDVMPQLVLPKNEDGTVAFHDGVQLYEFGAAVIREFISEVAPNVNYDHAIYADGDVTSAGDRHFAEHSAEEWFNIILNMGLDIGATYLSNITNFEDYLATKFGADFNLTNWITTEAYVQDPEYAIKNAHWGVILDTAILWAANYVGDAGTSVLAGFDPTTIAAIRNDDGTDASSAFDKLSYILNSLLPLGFINGCSSGKVVNGVTFDFDVSMFVEKVQAFVGEFDLNQLLSLFGRNEDSKYNFLMDKNAINAVLTLVNDILSLVFGADLITETCLNDVLTKANLQSLIKELFTNLYARSSALLPNALPIVALFIGDWGGEQELGTPDINISTNIAATNGSLTGTADNDGHFEFANGSTGVWRHYVDSDGVEHIDQQYKYAITSVTAEGFNGATSPVSGISFSSAPIDFGQSINVTFNLSNVPTSGVAVRFVVKYNVYDEDGNIFKDSNGNVLTFEEAKYSWISYNPTNERTETSATKDYGGVFGLGAQDDYIGATLYSPHYVPLSTAVDVIPTLSTGRVWRIQCTTGRKDVTISATSSAPDGLTFGTFTVNLGNGDHTYNNIQNFYTYDQYGTGEEDVDSNGNPKADYKVSVAGSVNEEEWKAAKKTPGSKTTFNVTLNADGTTAKPTLDLIYYDDLALNDLKSLVDKENREQRTTAEYHTHSNAVYADRVLVYEDDEETPDVNEKETNYSTTVWILEGVDGTITEVPEKTEGAKEVTKFTSALEVATTYMTAFGDGLQGAYQPFNTNAVLTDTKARYEALRIAANDVQYIKKKATEMEGASIDGAVVALKNTLNDVEATYSDEKDYTDYKMYRWNRFNDARNDAKDIINAYEAAKYINPDANYYPYTGIGETELRALVSGHAEEAHILGLLEPYTDEEMVVRKADLARAKEHYAGYNTLDVAQASNLITRMGDRLLSRDHEVITKYLDDEIASAENMIGDDNSSGYYTDRSWTKYIKALEEAREVAANPTQMTVFDAKWELLCCRNELVVKYDDEGNDNEADYTELEKLIDQAKMALKHPDLYNNSNKEFGQVLAELGFGYDAEGEEIMLTNANGDKVNIFPGNAQYINHEPYSVEDQDIVDRKADELKEALARLKFKTTTVARNDVQSGTGIADKEVVVEGNEEKNVEEVALYNVSRIGQKLDADAVKALFTATATNNEYPVSVSIVSDDVNYSTMEDIKGFIGTGATITFFTVVEGINVPVATVKLVVDADVNGDGVLDVIDASLVQLVSVGHAELDGAYFLAGNLDTASKGIVADDYDDVVNAVIAA